MSDTVQNPCTMTRNELCKEASWGHLCSLNVIDYDPDTGIVVSLMRLSAGMPSS